MSNTSNCLARSGCCLPFHGCIGSERVGKSGVTGVAMKEAQFINKSLSALGDVMEALDQKSKHIPYR